MQSFPPPSPDHVHSSSFWWCFIFKFCLPWGILLPRPDHPFPPCGASSLVDFFCLFQGPLSGFSSPFGCPSGDASFFTLSPGSLFAIPLTTPFFVLRRYHLSRSSRLTISFPIFLLLVLLSVLVKPRFKLPVRRRFSPFSKFSLPQMRYFFYI